MKKKFTPKRSIARRLGVGGAFLGSVAMVMAQDSTALQKENADLKARVDALEDMAKKEGLMPSGSPPKYVSAMSDITVSGFVQASYFYNLQRPANGESATYLWNTKDNSFSLNKFKLTVASKPLATDKWDAGFKVSLMFGDDAPLLNSGGINGNNGTNAPVSNSTFSALREAYVEVNVPIGTGLNIKAGELISLLNWESGDGGAANPNFSQGYQWWYTGNGPSAGIQGTYNFTDKIGLTLRIDNGLYQGPVDNNQGKAFSGSLAFKPVKDLWFNVIGWYDTQPGDTTTSGISSIGGYQYKKLGLGYEVDYFNFGAPGSSTDLWSVGGWAWYDFTDKVGLAFRADYVSQSHGVLAPAVRPGAGIISTEDGGDIGSLTLTLNLKPVPNIKIQPEIRYDYTSYTDGLNGKSYQIIVGCGASYMF